MLLFGIVTGMKGDLRKPLLETERFPKVGTGTLENIEPTARNTGPADDMPKLSLMNIFRLICAYRKLSLGFFLIALICLSFGTFIQLPDARLVLFGIGIGSGVVSLVVYICFNTYGCDKLIPPSLKSKNSKNSVNSDATASTSTNAEKWIPLFYLIALCCLGAAVLTENFIISYVLYGCGMVVTVLALTVDWKFSINPIAKDRKIKAYKPSDLVSIPLTEEEEKMLQEFRHGNGDLSRDRSELTCPDTNLDSDASRKNTEREEKTHPVSARRRMLRLESETHRFRI